MALAVHFYWVVDVRCVSLEQSDTMTGVDLRYHGSRDICRQMPSTKIMPASADRTFLLQIWSYRARTGDNTCILGSLYHMVVIKLSE